MTTSDEQVVPFGPSLFLIRNIYEWVMDRVYPPARLTVKLEGAAPGVTLCLLRRRPPAVRRPDRIYDLSVLGELTALNLGTLSPLDLLRRMGLPAGPFVPNASSIWPPACTLNLSSANSRPSRPVLIRLKAKLLTDMLRLRLCIKVPME